MVFFPLLSYAKSSETIQTGVISENRQCSAPLKSVKAAASDAYVLLKHGHILLKVYNAMHFFSLTKRLKQVFLATLRRFYDEKAET